MPEYSVSNLERGIEQAEKNIGVFEAAISKEHESIGQFKWMIEQAERKFVDRKKSLEITGKVKALEEELEDGDCC